VCLIKRERETGQAAEGHRAGTLCKIVDWTTLPDGSLRVTAHGECKIKVVASRVRPDQLLAGQVKLAQEKKEKALPPGFEPMGELLVCIINALGPPYSDLPGFLARLRG
jgi:Lon protease-like protein